MTSKRKKAIIRRRIFIALVVVIFLLLAAIGKFFVAPLIKNLFDNNNDTTSSSVSSSTSSIVEVVGTQSDVPKDTEPVDSAPESASSKTESTDKKDETVTDTQVKLDAGFSKLLLVNAKNPLPKDYDKNVELVTIENKYINGYRNQISAQVWPYAKAMIEAAWADGVELYILSPYRSYESQEVLFKNQVARVNGDEAKAATVVARPGTSEHNTGLCADFNMAEEEFENTKMYTWLCENAQDYGFILRYPKNKQQVTGVIYEAWHWRFVGINNAKEIKSIGVTLEEYMEMKGYDPKMDMYN